MSVRLEAANSERLDRIVFLTGAPSTDATVSGWFYVHSLPSAGNFAPLVEIYTPSAFTGWGVFVDDAGHLRIRDDNGDTESTAGTATIVIGQWYYFWARRVGVASAPVNVYLDTSTTSDVSHSVAVSTGDTSIQIGSNQASFDTDWYADASMFSWHYWTTDRPASEAAAQSLQAAFVTAGLARWLFDTFGDIDDDEGALDLTAVGTHSEGPANPWGGEPPEPAPETLRIVQSNLRW